jgi:hypothetical protein
MFVINAGGTLYGPFKKADDAVKWAKDELAQVATWSIVPIKPAK